MRNRIVIAEDYENLIGEERRETSAAYAAHPAARYVGAGFALLTCFLAIATYAASGSPSYQDQPLAWRIENDPVVEVAHNIERLETYLASNPEDGKAWALAGPIYFEYQAWGKAANAYLSAARYGEFDNSQKSQLLVMATRAMVSESEGIFTEPSAQIATAASRYDPENIQARFLEAQGNEILLPPEGAAIGWQRFIEKFAEDETGLLMIAKERVAELGRTPDPDASDKALGPTQEQIQAAANLSQEQQQLMVDGMVSRLANRLEENPNDLEGWLRLMRSYTVLEQTPKARDALEKARGYFDENDQALERLRSVAVELRLEP